MLLYTFASLIPVYIKYIKSVRDRKICNGKHWCHVFGEEKKWQHPQDLEIERSDKIPRDKKLIRIM